MTSRALVPFSWLYGAFVSWRNRRFDRDPSTAERLSAPVVSIGNLTVGGSGKTPFAAALARELLAKGHPVAVLSRGYGRKSSAPFVLVSDGNRISGSWEESGDEPLELARSVDGLAVAVGSDRAAVGRELLERVGPHVMLLDDGFQHRQLHRDLDLVCFDAREPEASLRLLPAGRLREPLESLARADAIVWTRCGDDDPSKNLIGILAAAAGRELPMIRTRHVITGFKRLGADEMLANDSFRNVYVGVFLGVARPDRILEAIPARVIYDATRRDHHPWELSEVETLSEEAKRRGATALLTTGKDAVKIASLGGSRKLALPVYVIEIETEIVDLIPLRALLERLPKS